MCDRLTSNDKQNYKNFATAAVSSVESVGLIVLFFFGFHFVHHLTNRNPITNLSVFVYLIVSHWIYRNDTISYTQTIAIVNGTHSSSFCYYFLFIFLWNEWKVAEKKYFFFIIIM